jgi:hypothetical protein
VAERYLHVPAGREERVPGGVRGRLLAVRGGAGAVPEPDGRARTGGVPDGGWGVRGSEGDADRSGAAVRKLAGEDAVPAGASERPGAPPDEPAAPPDDPGEGGTVLEDDLGGVPGAFAVRFVRGGAGTGAALGEVLQPPAAAPGVGGAVPGGPVLRDPARSAEGDRAEDPGERAGAGDEAGAEGAVLHGGADGRQVGGDDGGERAVPDARGRERAGERCELRNGRRP